MTVIHWLSWISLVSLIPPVAWILWIKNRSAINSWIRPIKHPERWLLSTQLEKSATREDVQKALRRVVTESKNAGWNATCAYKKRDPSTGEWTVGLISQIQPIDTELPPPFTFTKIEPLSVLRLSCPANEDNALIKSDLKEWAEENDTIYQPAAVSLAAQSFQCWEWEINHQCESCKPSLLARLAEKIFEMRDIALYPTIITLIALLLCGTGNFWLFGIGVFTIILMSGAHKFVFMYQREDITQEEHLQNY
ncbi:MAG: hypothetical protein AB8F34_08960 [Akkermansiaceae bacterium]